MKKKILFYIYPLTVIIPLAILMLRPSSFNLIPHTVYHAFKVSSMSEHEFIIWLDITFLALMYWLILRVTKRIIIWRKFKNK